MRNAAAARGLINDWQRRLESLEFIGGQSDKSPQRIEATETACNRGATAWLRSTPTIQPRYYHDGQPTSFQLDEDSSPRPQDNESPAKNTNRASSPQEHSSFPDPRERR